ncbi:Rhodanese-like domain-containing protein 8, chloroplastic [Glycine soja]|uniref:Rhodanese-like domain-containing protein 8, chloroplastic n=1 Tax=Glycine soja TaxID=3848 RepID=A0A445JAH3_GLYSO|nr:Rhodanese-like domain-containing protein 8, chloroplastic [Glycine soja]
MMRRKRKRKTRPRRHRIEGQERKDAVVQRGLLRVWVGCTCTCTRSRSYSFTTSFCNTSFVLQFQFQKPLFKFSNFSSLALTHCKLVPSALPLTQPSSSRKDFDFVVVNFYHFVFIQDPQAEVAKHRSFLELEGLDINGRVYLNEQGINAQYSGPSKDAMAYVNWLRKDNRFSNILVQISPSEKGHTFPILKLRYKSSLVQITASDPLSNVDEEKANILMYCTGGICCDVYSTILRCCRQCVEDLRGCCCLTCTTAPRRRPVLNGMQRYKKWHYYRDMDFQGKLKIST